VWSSRLGAKSGNTLVLNDPYVSSRHARLTWDGTAWYVEDLGSANGTVVDDKPCRPQARCPLPFGARLRIGPVVLELLA
jgi:pSer/pThr/pTyr-binding forkhead associated (FHA) protein